MLKDTARHIVLTVADMLPLPETRRQGLVVVVLLFIATALLAFRSIDDLDYGIHLGTGRWILQNGRVPTTDPFTWSIPEHAYIAYHWGFQVILAGLYDLMGHAGPVVLRFILVMATATALAGSFFLRRVNPIVAGVCCLLGLICAELRFAMRPELFTNLLLALLGFLLSWWRAGAIRALYLIPLVFLVWVNTHIYILGFALLFAEGVQQLVEKRRLNGRFVGVVAISVMVLFINPYGLDAVQEPLRLITRMNKENLFAQHISELASPFDRTENPRTPFTFTAHYGCLLVLLGLSAVSAWTLFKQRRFGDVFVVVVFSVLGGLAVRNVPVFIMAALPALAEGLSLAVTPLLKARGAVSRVVFNGSMCAVAILSFRVVNGSWYAEQRRAIHMKPDVEGFALAVEAAQFVENHNLQGKGFNNFNIGGALLGWAPSHPIFIDGRNEVTGEDFFRRYLEILAPGKFDEFAQAFNIEYVVLGHSNMMPLVRYLNASGKWKIVHVDAVALVMVRKDGPNGRLPEHPPENPITDNKERWELLNTIAVRPMLIDRLSLWLLGGEEIHNEIDKLGLFYLMMGRWAEAERLLLKSASLAPNFWETSNNLGALYTRMQLWEASVVAYRMVLMLNPSHKLAREREAMNLPKFKVELERQNR